MKWPKISIVTPSYNQGRFIEQTILSVINQNYPNLEYIIIDGGSTDETIDIIKKYETYFSYWVSEPDRGQSHAINKGLEKCTGEIFNWLNSDDWYLPGALFEIASKFVDKPSVVVVSGYENHIQIDGKVVLRKGTFLSKTISQTIERCEVTQPSTFFRLSAVKTIGPLPEDIHFIMDGELWVRLLLMYGQECFCKIQKPLVNFRLHENSKTVNNTFENNFLFERSSIITDLQHFVGVPVEIINYWIAHVYRTPKTYQLNRHWQINEGLVSKLDIRIYFIERYINMMFQISNKGKAYLGIKYLLSYKKYNFYTAKSIIKLLIK